jgi:hypothetical protein
MMYSPAGRFIEPVTGEPGSIIERGRAMTRLGRQMESCATTLETIKSSGLSDYAGKAVEKLQETIGDSYETLREAAELYKPLGPVIRDYGLALDSIQPTLNARASRCEQLWAEFGSLPGSVEPRGVGGLFQPEEGSDEAEEQADEDAAKKAAHDEFLEAAGLWDDSYDSWEHAFDTAVTGLNDEMAGTIEDGGWRSFLGWASSALGWVGLIVGVAALIIGGPILAAIALVVGVLLLAVTIVQAVQYGDKNGWDIALAVVGVLPFGKLGSKLLRPDLADEALDVFKVFKPSTWTKPFTNASEMDGLLSLIAKDGWRSSAGWTNALVKGLTGNSRDDWLGIALLHGVRDAGQSLRLGPLSMSLEFGYNVTVNVLKYENWVSKIGGGTSWRNQMPEPVRIFL